MTFSNTQKSVLFVVIVLLFISLMAAALAGAKWGFSRSARPDTARTITVADSAEVKAPPDTAYVNFSVVRKEKTAQDAAKMNVEKVTFVMAAIAKSGIPKNDIKTVNYSLEPWVDLHLP